MKTKPIPFLWSIIKPYKYLYFIMMLAPFANGVYPIIYSYAVKLLLDLFTQDQIITVDQSFKPVMVFLSAQVVLDSAWRAHNFAQLKVMPHVFQDMMDKICTHCFNLPYTYFQNNLSGSIVSKIKGIGDNYFKMHQALEYQVTAPILITIFSGIALAYVNINIFA